MVDVDAESYMRNNYVVEKNGKKMIMVNIINSDYKISSDSLCTHVCQPPGSAVCGGPCCTNTVCRLLVKIQVVLLVWMK